MGVTTDRSSSTLPYAYPATPKRPVAETLHGHKLVDDYRWLEDESHREVQAWTERQNEFTTQLLQNETSLAAVKKRVAKTLDREDRSIPRRFGEREFYSRRPIDSDLWELVVMDPSGDERVLVSLLGLRPDNAVSMDYWYPSPQGTYVAYGISEAGSEIATLYVVDVETGEVRTADETPFASHASLLWDADEKGYHYTRHDVTADTPVGEQRLHTKVYYHGLGTSYTDDLLVFGKGRPIDDMLALGRRGDSEYIVISATQGWTTNDLFVHHVPSRVTSVIAEGIDAKFWCAVAAPDGVYFITSQDAPLGRVCRLGYDKLGSPDAVVGADTLIPEDPSRVIEALIVTAEHLLVLSMVDAAGEAAIYSKKGERTGVLKVSDMSTFGAVHLRYAEASIVYSASSFFSPSTFYRGDLSRPDEALQFYQTPTVFVSEEYIATREWASASDGTKLPVFVCRRKDVTTSGANPTILYGYGGFASSQQPSYLGGSAMTWLESGGIWATAVIRGGGEYGEEWHKAAILDRKAVTFDDFAACAEHLIAKNFTDANHLGVLGGSNGGLLVGALAIRRPELVRAVSCEVPLLDMVHFHRFLIAGRWVHEYGNPDVADDLASILTWSPYHNVVPGVEYPAICIRTAESDTRVHPMHAWKMAALLQATSPHTLTMLRTEKASGHTTAAKSRVAMIESAAERIAYFGWQLGLDLTGK